MCECWHWAVELCGKHLIQNEEGLTMKNMCVPMPCAHENYALMAVMLSIVHACVIVHYMLHCVDDRQSRLMLFQFEIVMLAESSSETLNLCILN